MDRNWRYIFEQIPRVFSVYVFLAEGRGQRAEAFISGTLLIVLLDFELSIGTIIVIRNGKIVWKVVWIDIICG